MNPIFKIGLRLVDVMLILFVYPAAFLLKTIRAVGIQWLPVCKRVLMQVGVFPIRNTFYEPLFDSRKLTRPLDQDRELPGIDWNVSEQLRFLEKFRFSEELKDVPPSNTGHPVFSFENVFFGAGDAEYLYNLVRLKKPSKIFEIGCGHSTLLIRKAVSKNQDENPGRRCKHLCIEPYMNPWLEETGVTVIRQKVEDIDRAVFAELEEDDILFIDSSHMIRPQGDVLFLYLELLPSLKRGVIVHVHDIFSPKDYPKKWIIGQIKFWNEQYLLEAFLSSNHDWKILGALNFLHHHHSEPLKAKCPFLTGENEPGSFYIKKVV